MSNNVLTNRRTLWTIGLGLLLLLTALALVQLSSIPAAYAEGAAAEVSGAAEHNQNQRRIRQEPNLPLNLALIGAREALHSCTDSGFNVSVTVVDASGVTQVQLRSDGAGPHTIGSSDGKAYTAASLRRSTLELANFVGTRPDLEGLRDMDDRILILGGGLPIEVDGVVVGGIGVGGAPGGDLDEACARAGIDEILKRVR